MGIYIRCKLLLAHGIQSEIDFDLKILGYIPFLSFVVLNGNNNLSAYSEKLNQLSVIISPMEGASSFLGSFSCLSWIIFTLPYLCVGILSIASFLISNGLGVNTKSRNLNKQKKTDKLPAPSDFLESFFSKDEIIENIYKRSVSENFEILKYFKGGSDAITILVEKSSFKYVHKITGQQGMVKLKNQYDWLNEIKSEGIVKAISSKYSNNYFEIEMEYIDDSIALFEYIHTNSIQSAKDVIIRALNILEKDVYGNPKMKSTLEEFQTYIQRDLYDRLTKVSSESLEFKRFLNSRVPISINGKTYLDLLTVLERICTSKKCLDILTSMQVTERCHGDFTIDNILVRNTTEEPILIDPSDDNILKGPLLDLSRLMQSLLGGYEFLNQDYSDVMVSFEKDKLIISYSDLISSKYIELADWLVNEIYPNKLSKNELIAVKFHVGLFYARMLTHRYSIQENTMMKYAAVSTRFLNEFYREVNSYE